MSFSPRITVVVPARELTDQGRRCLATLSERGEEVEVVFVPDRATTDVPPRVICVPSGDAPVGTKRQLGLERSTADVVAWMDDDAYPHVSWLENVLAEFADDDTVGAVCGPTITPHEAPELERLSGRVFASWLVSGPDRWRYGFAPRATCPNRRVSTSRSGARMRSRSGSTRRSTRGTTRSCAIG